MFTESPVMYDFVCSSGFDSRMFGARRQERSALHAKYTMTPAPPGPWRRPRGPRLRHRAVTFQRGAGILIATATLARADAHRGIDVQPGAVPETGRRGPGSRLRLRRTGPDLDHLGTGETPVRGGRPRE